MFNFFFLKKFAGTVYVATCLYQKQFKITFNIFLCAQNAVVTFVLTVNNFKPRITFVHWMIEVKAILSLN